MDSLELPEIRPSTPPLFNAAAAAAMAAPRESYFAAPAVRPLPFPTTTQLGDYFKTSFRGESTFTVNGYIFTRLHFYPSVLIYKSRSPSGAAGLFLKINLTKSRGKTIMSSFHTITATDLDKFLASPMQRATRRRRRGTRRRRTRRSK